MLEMKPNCECCDKDFTTTSTEVMICSFECTFCKNCVDEHLRGVCPNCGGSFTQRPTRAEALLEKFPASTQRKYNPELMSK